MKFGSWCSKGQAILRNLRRFWPVVLGMAAILTWRCMTESLYSADSLLYRTGRDAGVWLTIYGFFSALLLMGDLFDTRYAHGSQGFPSTREARFLDILLSALVMVLLPLIPAFVVNLVRTDIATGTSMLWVGAMIIFWFYGLSLGLLASSVSGTVAASILTGVILLVGPDLLETLLRTLVRGLVAGTNHYLHGARALCPLIALRESDYLGPNWAYMGWVTLGSLVLTLLALVLYKKRPLERTGMFMVFPGMKAVIKVLATLMGGLVLGLILLILQFDGLYGVENPGATLAWVIPSFAIALIVAEMITEQTMRVFRRKNLFSMGLSLVAVVGLVFALHLDVFGLETYVPKSEQISSVSLKTAYATATVSDPENVAQVMALHQCYIDYMDADTSNPRSALFEDYRQYSSVELCYTLNSGRKVYRRYNLMLEESHEGYAPGGQNHPIYETMYTLYNDPDWLYCALGTEEEDPELRRVLAAGNISSVGPEYSSKSLEGQNNLLLLLQAMEEDMAAGKLWLYPGGINEYSQDHFRLYIRLKIPNEEHIARGPDLTIWVSRRGSATATLLRSLNLLDNT